MAERERIRLGDGVSIFRQHRTWILDLGRRGRRIRASLVTPDTRQATASPTKLSDGKSCEAGTWIPRLA
jgi:hypothetical protein